MDTKTALGAAGGISLTVAGAVSALVLTLGGGASAEPAPPQEATIEYVDQFGNPVDLEQQVGVTIPEIVVTTEAPALAGSSEQIVAEPASDYEEVETYAAEEYEEEEYEEDEEHDEEYDEYAAEEYEEEEYDDDDEYEEEDDD